MIGSRVTSKAILISILFLVVLCSCESFIDIEVGVIWREDQHFDRTCKAYVGLLKGKWDSDTGFDGDLLEVEEVCVGTNSDHSFVINAGRSAHYTAFIYFDDNGNDQYDEGYDYVVGYKYNWGKLGSELKISLSACY